MKGTIGIIGYGVVGKAFANVFKDKVKFLVYDKYIPEYRNLQKVIDRCAAVFIAVPTPMNQNGSIDISCVEDVLKRISMTVKTGGTRKRNPVVVLRSTIVPGTTRDLQKEFSALRLVFNPEFLSERNSMADMERTDRVIIGGQPRDCKKVEEIYRQVFPQARYIITDTTTAEMIKYAANVTLAGQVMIANELFQICRKLGLDWAFIRNAVILDPLIGRNTKVPGPDGDRGFGGKCVISDTSILTRNGIKKADEVRVGDFVLTHDGTFKKVLNVFKREVNEDVVAIKPQGFEPALLTMEHPVWAIQANRKYKKVNKRNKFSNYKGNAGIDKLNWIPAGNIRKGDYIVWPIIKSETGQSLFTSDQAFFLGIYLAEGSIDKNRKNRVYLACDKRDKDTNNQILSNIYKTWRIKARIENINSINGGVIRFSDQNVKEFVSKHCSNYAWNKKLSEELFMSCINHANTRKNLLRGLFLGDGSISSNVYNYTTTSKQLYMQVRYLLFAEGIAFTCTTNKAHGNHRESYAVRIRASQEIEKIGKIMSGTTKYLPTPKVKKIRNPGFFVDDLCFMPVKQVSQLPYSGVVCNFEVKNNETYLANTFIVHNCLPKDLLALIHLSKVLGYDPKLLSRIWESNLLVRENRNWENIKGATSFKKKG